MEFTALGVLVFALGAGFFGALEATTFNVGFAGAGVFAAGAFVLVFGAVAFATGAFVFALAAGSAAFFAAGADVLAAGASTGSGSPEFASMKSRTSGRMLSRQLRPAKMP